MIATLFYKKFISFLKLILYNEINNKWNLQRKRGKMEYITLEFDYIGMENGGKIPRVFLVKILFLTEITIII